MRSRERSRDIKSWRYFSCCEKPSRVHTFICDLWGAVMHLCCIESAPNLTSRKGSKEEEDVAAGAAIDTYGCRSQNNVKYQH